METGIDCLTLFALLSYLGKEYSLYFPILCRKWLDATNGFFDVIIDLAVNLLKSGVYAAGKELLSQGC